MIKPEVRYVDLARFEVGRPARVLIRRHPKLMFPLDQPVWIRTSRVLALLRETSDGPEFETRNSIYKPYPLNELLPITDRTKTVIPEKAGC